ncbi:TetR/AcrR family transcriptional regulator [Streptomyces sp. HNM0575]|uniref:TetR/AcrR family transcriptional regulator n=1 Tax=Streptomyces sp. HNM0575 TaxID=2716338 RepID=UPI00145C8D09|nr:TetR/AcrR family transcriptional regulator [Streptomyces sp. HNM0575]NLU73308.1 TetR/AcrR family transcriptional regulator [Streptomyces sp. HNM0575]
MRADATRNLDAVLRAAARLFATDSGTRIVDVAAAAGVDQRTVYRRFESREELLLAVYRARLDAVDALIDTILADDEPVLSALRAFAEGGIRISREWPVDIRAAVDTASLRRRQEVDQRMSAFLRRAEREGVIAEGLPERWPLVLLQSQLHCAAHDMPELTPGEAADLVVRAFLGGIGA